MRGDNDGPQALEREVECAGFKPLESVARHSSVVSHRLTGLGPPNDGGQQSTAKLADCPRERIVRVHYQSPDAGGSSLVFKNSVRWTGHAMVWCQEITEDKSSSM